MAKGSRGAYRFASKIPGLLDELYGNQKFVWTEEMLRVEAAKYESLSDFQKGSGGAYVTCIKRFPNLLPSIFERQIQDWKTESAVRLEMAKHATRSELQSKCSGCYKSVVAKFPHLLDEFYGPALVRRIDSETCLAEARLCSSRGEFADRYVGSYQYALRHGIDLDSLFPKRYVYWDEAMVRAEARKYRTRSEFYRGCISGYGFAWTNDLLDDLGFEDADFGFKSGSPAYLYIADITLVDRTDGTLFGITNNHPNYRYRKYEHQHLSNHTAFLFSTGSTAREVETAIKREFCSHKVVYGLSPLRDKSGTSGEILRGVDQSQIVKLVTHMCVDIEATTWGHAEA